ncbi:MAG: Gfo/Idh/MocA family oxidoreductase [Christensenellaceae bacterium]|nr:Gfo/Idh/MocA family oxidoreductase [Christensenellaceae bacterium]
MSVSIGVAGLGFGREFVPIYLKHPNVDKVAINCRTPETLQKVGDENGIPEEMRFLNYDEMLACPDLNAIHVVTPPNTHYEYVMRALEAGKNVACTVPMGLSNDELKNICKKVRQTGLKYMMMETAIYTREYLYAKNLVTTGQLGKIQFVRGSHMQDMSIDGWAGFWLGLPPMWYGTHAISPLLDITQSFPEYVICHGSGTLRPELTEKYGSPFAIETTTIKLKDTDLCAEATRSLYDTVRQYRESFDVYGTKMAFEWEQLVDEGCAIHYGGEEAGRVVAPDVLDCLPESIRQFSKKENISDPTQPSFIQGSGHGGSHPHLVHEFISAIVEDRKPYVDEIVSANFTSAGICSHESAMKGGEKVYVPDFTKD